MITELWIPCELWTWNAERRMHHHERAKRVREVRVIAYYLAVHVINGGGQRISEPVTVTFFPVQAKGVLADTAGHGPPCKALLDGLVDAKLIPADDPTWVLSQTYMPPTRNPVTGVRVVLAAPTLPERRSVG